MAFLPVAAHAQTSPLSIPPAIASSIGAIDIGSTVASAQGPKISVWVNAETTDLPTKFAKIVVTDDAGRYVIPALSKANHQVCVRGYDLIASLRGRSVPRHRRQRRWRLNTYEN